VIKEWSKRLCHNYHRMCTTAIPNAGKPRSSDPMHNLRLKITKPGIFVHQISINVHASATSVSSSDHTKCANCRIIKRCYCKCRLPKLHYAPLNEFETQIYYTKPPASHAHYSIRGIISRQHAYQSQHSYKLQIRTLINLTKCCKAA